jgi:hypothetical protein
MQTGYSFEAGGKGEIRTRERLSPLAVFKTAAFNRSATFPSSLNHHTSPFNGLDVARELNANWFGRKRRMMDLNTNVNVSPVSFSSR